MFYNRRNAYIPRIRLFSLRYRNFFVSYLIIIDAVNLEVVGKRDGDAC